MSVKKTDYVSARVASAIQGSVFGSLMTVAGMEGMPWYSLVLIGVGMIALFWRVGNDEWNELS